MGENKKVPGTKYCAHGCTMHFNPDPVKETAVLTSRGIPCCITCNQITPRSYPPWYYVLYVQSKKKESGREINKK